jgi:hypothetical protein
VGRCTYPYDIQSTTLPEGVGADISLFARIVPLPRLAVANLFKAGAEGQAKIIFPRL